MIKHFASAVVALLFASGSVAAAHVYTAGALRIGHPWSRPTPAGAPTAAGYLTITNTGSKQDRLLSGTTPLATSVEVHQMSMTGGIMRMRSLVGGLVLPPGQTVTLEPGGDHLMIIGPKRVFKLGDHVPATLRFERAGEIRVEFYVEDAPASAPMRTMSGMPGMTH